MDVGDPMYQLFALRYTDALTRRYTKPPALLAFEIDNEPGHGPISYSAAVKTLVIGWLREKHGTMVATGPAFRLPGAANLGVPDDYRTAALPRQGWFSNQNRIASASATERNGDVCPGDA